LKKLWHLLPGALRWLLVTILIMGLAAGSVLAYKALTGTGTVTVVEALSWVGPNTFDVQLYPQESTTQTLTLANASSLDLDVDIDWKVKPDPLKKGLTVTIPTSITVPAYGQQSFNVQVVVSKSAEPGTYTITYDIVR